jgi:hypothetical protein
MTMAVCAHLDQIKLTEPRDGPIQVGCQAEPSSVRLKGLTCD